MAAIGLVLGAIASVVMILQFVGTPQLPHVDPTPDQSKSQHADPTADQSKTVPAAIQLTPESGRAGSTVIVKGEGFTPNQKVEIHFHSNKVADSLPDSNGRFTLTFKVPLFYGQFPDSYSVQAVQAFTMNNDDATFKVTG
ncbi:hypothetical protein [Streptomyces sp. NPDC052107]|uniref:hypothetical protein n=1 Tax=Streptomyces sp. NPDC052107 TaxID=3155632 RepID=UPI003440FE97